MYRLLALVLVGLALSATVAECVETDNLRATLSLTNKAGASGSATDYAWSLNGLWSDRWGHHDVSLTVDSDYSRGDDGQKYDRLKTWLRYTLKNQPGTEWTPLLLVSTEGDHRAEQLQTLAALGLHKGFAHGFLELSAGAS